MPSSYCCCDAAFGFLRAPNTYDRSDRPSGTLTLYLFLSGWQEGRRGLTTLAPITDTIVTVLHKCIIINSEF